MNVLKDKIMIINILLNMAVNADYINLSIKMRNSRDSLEDDLDSAINP